MSKEKRYVKIAESGKLSGQVKLGGHWVELRSGKCPEKKKKGRLQPWGLATFGSNQIWLSKDLCPQKQASICLHEVLEHLNDLLDISMEHPKLSCLTEGIYQFLMDNPELVKIMLRKGRIV